jgi:hypothetical protein
VLGGQPADEGNVAASSQRTTAMLLGDDTAAGGGERMTPADRAARWLTAEAEWRMLQPEKRN